MTEHHHHHHHRQDGSSLYKEKSLNSIAFRRKFEKWLKIILAVIAVLMVFVAVFVYLVD